MFDWASDHSGPEFTMACQEQPQQRLENFGTGALSDTELLALILQDSGTRPERALAQAAQLLAAAGSLAGLAAWVPADYRRRPGIGRTKARQLGALAEIARRMLTVPPPIAPIFNCPEAIAAHFAPLVAGLQIEKFWVLCLNRRNRLIKQVEITSGTATAVLAHPREVYRAAIRESAAAITCIHNLCAAAHRA